MKQLFDHRYGILYSGKKDGFYTGKKGLFLYW